MTRFFIKWWVDTAKIPNTPEETGKFYWPMFEMIKADLSAGKFTDWGQFSNGREGFAISELSEAEIFASMLKWTPVVQFEMLPVLSIEQTMEARR